MPNEPIPELGSQEEDKQWLMLQPAFSAKPKKKKKKPVEDLLASDAPPGGELDVPEEETLRSKLAKRKLSVMTALEKE